MISALFSLAWSALPRLPDWCGRFVFVLVADIAWLLHGKSVRRLESNLRRVQPNANTRELRNLSRRGMRSYMRYYCEAFQLRGWSRERILAKTRATGAESALAELAANKLVVGALGHLGNWDLAGAFAAIVLGPVTTVAERLKPERLFRDYTEFRESVGIDIIPLDDSGGSVFRELLRAGRNTPRLIPLLVDRDLTARGVEVQFFGEAARMAAGPSALAQATGAKLYPVSLYYEKLPREKRRLAGGPWGLVAHFHEEVEVPQGLSRSETTRTMVQACATSLEKAIMAHPEDWHMLQRVFTADLDPARDVAVTESKEPS